MASSSRSAILFLCILAIFACPAVLGDAGNPLETHEQPLPTTLQPQQTNRDLEEETHEFGDPKSYNHVLRLPSAKDDSISTEERPSDVYPKWEPRFPVRGRPFIMPFHREFGKSRYLDERDLIFRRFPLGSTWPFRFGRPGGCDHSKRKHFLMRRDYGRRIFPGSKGPDSVALHLDFDGELGTFHIFQIQPESAGFRPEHRFGPADLEESKPYDFPVGHHVPEEHVHWVFPKEAAPRSHEEQEEGPVGRWMRWLKSLFPRT